jgi:hypothetical protein
MPRAADTADAGNEAVHHVPEQRPEQGARQTTTEQADDRANDFSPPVARYAEPLCGHVPGECLVCLFMKKIITKANSDQFRAF